MPTKHPFQSAKADGADATLVRPSNWNADHTVEEQYGPNLVLNSDFGRRTVFGLAMPEVFGDTSGYVVVSGAAPTVGSNIVTSSAANELAWCNQSFVWRDGRASGAFKAVATAGTYRLFWRISSTDSIFAQMTAGTFTLSKKIASVESNVATVAQALTLNRWYWLELDKQGTTITVKIYDTGGTVPGVTKASSTLLQTLSGTVADASVAVGAHVSVSSDQALAQWGGIASGNGGVYVETWLPESNSLSAVGTLGGQAWGFDESADAGPIGKQWALRMYVPATSRILQGLPIYTKTLQVVPSAAYMFSGYLKVSGLGGSGVLVRFLLDWLDSSGALISTVLLTDAGETAWTRKSTAVTSPATAKYAVVYLQANPGSTATGTGFASCLQLEQGSAATTLWRNAPADDAPIVTRVGSTVPTTTTSTSFVNADPRDEAVEIFLPWDAQLVVSYNSAFANNTASDGAIVGIFVDGAAIDGSADGHITLVNNASTAALLLPCVGVVRGAFAAGKHRVSVQMRAVTGGTASLGSTARPSALIVTATRGK